MRNELNLLNKIFEFSPQKKVFLVKYISTKVLKILMFTTLNSALSLLSRILSFIPLETPRDLY